ncbi:protein I'm not dead yet [Cephus cinctus]|uniref:Protein I'm not dead yet n=1 Tax=Cephus cinctus TaxID=211228 RepID=A0AAJ7FHE7_CEPCN|nr:protein I'm not dead yet [Cephus cinctus]XP_024939264.1 protein I'm not dead yet [Cephus cinctus]
MTMVTKVDDFNVEDSQPEMKSPLKGESCFQLLGRFLRIYWRSLFLILVPIIFLPLIILNNNTMYRCLYVLLIMACYWIAEVLPLAVTSVIPIVLYPLLGILSTAATTLCYMNDTAMMFIASLAIAIAIQTSGLHMRVALWIIKLIGCSHRRLSFGLFFVTMFISMWISNTAATAMMVPIVQSVLEELEKQGLGNVFVTTDDESKEEEQEASKKPTPITISHYLAASYASSIGGIGTIVGSGTTLSIKGYYESRFPNGPGINFSSWMMYAVPPMLIMSILTWIWLQILYMGLFRPNSKEARAVDIGKEGERVATAVIEKKYKELGPITWGESCVGLLFIAVIFLWFFREPGFVKGWPNYITDVAVKDSTAGIAVMIILFALPANLNFLNSFSKDPSKRPTKASSGLLTWKLIHQNMHWNLLFIFGGGFAIAAGSTASGLSTMLGNALIGLQSLNPVIILFIACLLVETLTEMTANVSVANIVIPVLVEMCVAIKLHPMYMLVPGTMSASFSFHLPAGTPPNAIACAAGHIRTKDLMIAGIGPSIITLVTTTILFPTWGNYVFQLSEFPEWAV